MSSVRSVDQVDNIKGWCTSTTDMISKCFVILSSVILSSLDHFDEICLGIGNGLISHLYLIPFVYCNFVTGIEWMEVMSMRKYKQIKYT
jgi:hypothetical protein